MAFSTNQVRQLYVATAYKTPSIVSTDSAGSIAVKSDTDKSHLYLSYMGSGGLTRSDLINTSNITYIKATDADSLARNLKKTKITLDSTINSGDPVAGEDYFLKIYFKNFIGISEEDQNFKMGDVHAISGMTASTFYKIMVLSLVKNFSKDVSKTLKFYLETGGTSATTAGTLVEVTATTVASTLAGTYTGMVIEEVEQDWILGTFPLVALNYTILTNQVTVSGDELYWGVVNDVTSTSVVSNGKNAADLEYFCMGERGDIYRNIGFPNVIKTNYLVDSSLAYNTIEIHYNHQDWGEGVQKSEKHITILVPKVGATNSVSNVLTNSILAALGTATGLTVSALDTTGS